MTPRYAKCQFTLTVAEGKRLIAKGVAAMPEVRKALEAGLILLKGGTTVSAIAEELCGQKLRISGRITPRGTVSAGNPNPGGAHLMLLRKGIPEPCEGRLKEAALSMGPGDVAICGANIFDTQGNAALMAGKDLGGETGSVYPSLEAEGIRCIVAAGLEKLSPEPLREASRAAGRKTAAWATGMAVGLIPIPGQIITELDALSILGYGNRWLIGRGGIGGAEGACTFLVEGDEKALEQLGNIIRSIKGSRESGTADSLAECLESCAGGSYHLACVYRRQKKAGKPS